MNALENQVTTNQEDTSQYDEPLIIVNKNAMLIPISEDNLIYNKYMWNMPGYIYHLDNTISAKITLVMQLLEKFLGDIKPTLGISDRKIK